MAIFEGAGVALVTPMNENLEVNYDKLEELLEEQIAGGTDAIVICGTTGESATLTEVTNCNGSHGILLISNSSSETAT